MQSVEAPDRPAVETTLQMSSFRELVGLLIGPRFGIRIAPVLRDLGTDPGLFGPGSATWRVAREPLLLLGGGRALLMQLAHPLIAQGVADHSDLESDPLGRLVRTARWLIAVTFGTRAEATAAIREVNILHRRVRGTLTPANACSGFDAGARYGARDPELAQWVQATVVQSMLVTHDALVGGLTTSDRDSMVREWDAVALLMGVSAHRLFTSAAALDSYVAAQAERLDVAAPAGRSAARIVLHPPLPSAAVRPAFSASAFLTIGMLPAPFRRSFGVPWTLANQSSYAVVTRSLRTLQRHAPRRYRHSAIYVLAMRRCSGRYAHLHS
jgi:uncharacterized protein (DUF2236 family)